MAAAPTLSMLIGGEVVQAEGGATDPVINPATGETFTTVPSASEADLGRAVAAAKEAFKTWRNVPYVERCAMLTAFGEAISEQKAEFAKMLTMEQGKPLPFAIGEVGMVGSLIKDAVAVGELTPEVCCTSDKGRAEEHYLPRGVVGAITPWNFPFMIAIQKMVPAILTGNTIVIKPSPFTPVTTAMLSQAAAGIFPAGVVNIVIGGNDLGQKMVEHPDIACITFTGSSATGKKIMATGAKTLKKVLLELGGNDAAIVLPGSDVDKFAPEIVGKAMFNCGQVCVAIKRVYVHEADYDNFVEKAGEAVSKIVVGDGLAEGTGMGPLNNEMQFKRIGELVEDARSNKARVVCGGGPCEPTGKKAAYFYQPTVIADVDESVRIVNEEQFGPVLPVLKYSTVEEAVQRANDTSYGLGGSVWGNDTAEASKVALQLEAGSIWVNSHLTSGLDLSAPFGGIKGSGIGKEGGNKACRKEYVDTKVVYLPKLAEE